MKLERVEFLSKVGNTIFCNAVFSKRKGWFSKDRIEYKRRVMLDCIIPVYCDTGKDVQSRYWDVLEQEIFLAAEQSISSVTTTD